MTEKSGLAAVAAAAAGTAAATQPEMTAERLKADHPSVYDAVYQAGATAEHERVTGIEKASIPGHEAIIAAHKADRSKSPADAALAVIAAENKARAGQLKALDKDEKKVSGLRSEASDEGDRATRPERPAHETAKAAREYQSEMASKGINVTAAEAVAHVSKEG